MEFLQYITDEALILIPVLNILGMLFKSIEKLPDKFIPLILLVFGVAGTLLLSGVSADSVIQGILVTGTAVYGNQVVKQIKKSE